MNQYPISCIPCRRRKVRCNRRKPCSFCVKNGLKCEFPTKFRNIDLQRNGGVELFEEPQFADTVAQLQKEKESILDEVKRLKEKVDFLESQEGSLNIAGETTELGEKYYGPLLSNYMVELLQRDKNQSPLSGLHSSLISKSVSHNSGSHETGKDEESETESDASAGMAKKHLPHLLDEDASYEENLSVLIFLVKRFFASRKYANFISQPLMLNFVKNNELIKEDNWENDDDLLLLYMILVILVHRLTPQEYLSSGLCVNPPSSMDQITAHTSRLIKNLLFPNFVRLRHNLLNESVVTVQAHILCIEWHVIEKLYEEAWSMLFHSCSTAYSIGLHVIVNLRTASQVTDKTAQQIVDLTEGLDIPSEHGSARANGTNSSDDEDDNDDYRISRFKVWFALKHISAQLCSMLGRPSPILIQVDLLVLQSAGCPGLSKMGLERKETLVHLKMGLSECMRLSNLMLIESYMMSFDHRDIERLEVRFQEESKTLAWFASAEYQNSIEGKECEINQYSDIPLHVGQIEVLTDLVALHVNRAKFLQPFIHRIVSGAEGDYIFTSLCGAILEFLKCTVAFVKAFLQRHVPKFTNPGNETVKNATLHKSLKSFHPFDETFIYQGMIVVFAVFSRKVQELLSAYFIEFLKETNRLLVDLLAVDLQCERLLAQKCHFWSKNVAFLIDKNIQYANQIFQRFEANTENQSANSDAILGSDITESDSMAGFNADDPFWITNPENLPFYLNNPSNEDIQQQSSYGASGLMQPSDTYLDPQVAVTSDQNTITSQSRLSQPSSSNTAFPLLLLYPSQVPIISEEMLPPSTQRSAVEGTLQFPEVSLQQLPGSDHTEADSVSTSLELLLTLIIDGTQMLL